MLKEAVAHVRRLPYADLGLVAARYGVRLKTLKAAMHAAGVYGDPHVPSAIRREAADPSALTDVERTILAMARGGARKGEICRAVGRERHTMIDGVVAWLTAHEPGFAASSRSAPDPEPAAVAVAPPEVWTLRARVWGERAIVCFADRQPPDWAPLRRGLLREAECPPTARAWQVPVTLVLAGEEVRIVSHPADHWPRVVCQMLLPGTYPLVVSAGAPPYGRLTVPGASRARRPEPVYRQAYQVNL